MQANSRALPTSVRFLVLAAGMTAIAGGSALAQTPNLPPPGAEQPVPVEILAEAAPGGITCRPAEARLPAQTQVALRVANRSASPVRFEIPELLQAGRLLNVQGGTAERDGKGVLVAPGVVGQIMIQTPGPGNYPFGCTLMNNANQAPPVKGMFAIAPPA